MDRPMNCTQCECLSITFNGRSIDAPRTAAERTSEGIVNSTPKIIIVTVTKGKINYSC